MKARLKVFPHGSVVKNLPANAGDAGDVGLIPGSGRSPGGGNGNPLQYSCLENPMDRGAWWATAHGVTQSQACLPTHAHEKQASPSHGKGPDRPSACVSGLLQRQLQQEEAGVLQTVSTRCTARPHRSTCQGPVPPGTRNKRVRLTLKKD